MTTPATAPAIPSPARRPEPVFLSAGTVATVRRGERLYTIAGSGMAVCLWSPDEPVGGMAHFVMPGGGTVAQTGHRDHESSLRALLSRIQALTPGRQPRLRARIAGGASLLGPLSGGEQLGQRNTRVAREWLRERGIPLEGEDCGGTLCRKVEFDIDTGRVSVHEILSLSKEVAP